MICVKCGGTNLFITEDGISCLQCNKIQPLYCPNCGRLIPEHVYAGRFSPTKEFICQYCKRKNGK